MVIHSGCTCQCRSRILYFVQHHLEHSNNALHPSLDPARLALLLQTTCIKCVVAKRYKAVIRSALILFFGALPASILSLYAGLGVVFAVGGVASGELGALFLGLWGAAGIYGAIALWVAAFGSMTRFVYVGLLLGTIAIVPIIQIVQYRPAAEGFLNNFVAIAAPFILLVAVSLFIELGVKSRSS